MNGSAERDKMTYGLGGRTDGRAGEPAGWLTD